MVCGVVSVCVCVAWVEVWEKWHDAEGCTYVVCRWEVYVSGWLAKDSSGCVALSVGVLCSGGGEPGGWAVGSVLSFSPAPLTASDSRMWFVKSFLLLFIVIVLSFPSTRLRFSSNPKRSQNEDCVAQWQRVGFQSQRLRVRFSSRSSFFGFSSQKASAGRHPGLFFAPPDPYMRLEMDVSYLQLQF